MRVIHFSLWRLHSTLFARVITFALVTAFTLSPISAAFAQESGSDTPPADTGGTTEPASSEQQTQDPPGPEFSIPGVDSSSGDSGDDDGGDTQLAPEDDTTESKQTSDAQPLEDTDKEVQPESLLSGGDDTPPTVTSPSVFTLDNSRPKADGQSGALVQNLKLDIPPGRNGLQPDLALQYNSQRAEDSIVGYGWTVSIPYIQRLNKTGSQNLYNVPYFTSSIDGELATTSTTTSSQIYSAKVDEGNFNTYSFTNNVWTMYDKNGTQYLFGASDNSQQNASASSTQIYKWMLQEVRDTNNNYVRYVYTKDGNQVYPSQILYTGNNNADGIFSVDFTKSTRQDTYTNFLPGFLATTSYSISKITASANGTIVREYNLSYTNGNNGKRTLLSSIQENGWDANHANQVTYPALSFAYVNSSTAFVTPPSPLKYIKPGTIVADANGDAINDITIAYRTDSSSPISGSVSPGGGSGSTAISPSTFWARSGLSCNPYPAIETGTRYVDLNADGKADMVQGGWDYTQELNVSALWSNTYSTSTGYGWTGVASSTWNGEIPEFSKGSLGVGPYTTGILGDVNGDGLPDYERRLDGSGVASSTSLGNGSTWDAATTSIFLPPFSMPYTVATVTNSQLIDINGDGLQDWVYSDLTSTYVRLNNGRGWESSARSEWTISTSTLYNSPSSNVFYDRGIRFIDINGDGLQDFVRSYRMGIPSSNIAPSGESNVDFKIVLLNTGSGWATSTSYTLPQYIAEGIIDSGAWNGQFCNYEYSNWTGNGQNPQDVLSAITYPQGGTTYISYGKSAQLGGNPELPTSLLVVSALVNNDGVGTMSDTSYSYSGGKMYSAQGARQQKFAGFATAVETSSSTISTTYFNQGDTINTSLGEQGDGYGQISHPFRVDVRKASDNSLLKQTFTRWDTFGSTTASTTFVFKAREVAQDYSPSGAHRDSAVDYSYSTSTGNLTTVTRYGEVIGNSDGTFSDTGTDKGTETILYAVSTTTQVRSLPYNSTLLDQSSNKVRETRRTYDGLTLGSVSKGNETKNENWITSSTYASTTKAYDGTYGLITQSRDAIGNLSTSTYDTYNLYVATTTNPLFQTTGYTYDYSTGKTKTVFDANNRLNTVTYDGIGRPLTVNSPDPSTGVLVTKTAYVYTDSATPGSTKVMQTDYLNAGTSSVSYLYFDGLNRKLQSRKTAEASNYVVNDWTYNNVGLLNSETLPYFATGSARSAVASTSQLFTTYTYDALQRTLTSTNVIGVTSNAYNGWTVTTTDPNGKTKDYVKDAYGNLANVVERIGTTTATTTYTYDLNKNFTKITDSLSNIRNFTYDGLGRRLTAQDLHVVGDATFGVATSTYDVAGNLTQTLDAKSQTVNYTYDALNRVLTEDYTGAAGTEISYAYDTCQDGKTRLCAATTTDAVTNLTYTPNGLTASEKKTIDSTVYTNSFVYDRQGNITDITYPDLSAVRYGYDDVGLLDTIARKATSTYALAIKELRYAPTGAVSYKKFGNDVVTTYAYDASNLYRLSGIVTTASSTVQGGAGAGGKLGLVQNPFAHFADSSHKSLSPLPVRIALAKVTAGMLALNSAGGEVTLIATSTSAKKPVATSISERIEGKPSAVRANIKGEEIAKIGSVARTSRGDYSIEITSMRAIDRGVEVFARAWDKNGQIGFGEDGSIDVERFMIYNPPVLVPDQNGGIVRTHKNPETGADIVKKYREDPREALLQVLEHTIGLKKLKFGPSNIENGKIGKTTWTFYSDANPEASSVDGTVYRNAGAGGETWGTIISSAGTNANDTSTDEWTVQANAAGTANKYTQVARGVFLFDTSPIIDLDTIASSTMSMWGLESSGSMSDAAIGIYAVNPASTTSLTPADYGTFGSTPYSNTTLGLDTTWNEAGYNNFQLNATGLAAVSKTGVTKFGQREAAHDATGVAPDWASLTGMHFGTQTADKAGTTNDPKLVVETSSVPPGTGIQEMSYYYDANGNITRILDTSITNAYKDITYGYDDVNRLTSASTTIATSSPFSQTYAYNSVGNITGWKTDSSATTTYAYAGTNYANPHAPTTIAGVNYVYDNNGNLTSGGGKFYTWDYRNRITAAGNGTATSTFGYDHNNQRIRKTFSGATTTYPSKYVNKVVSGTSTATTTDYIYMGDSIIAEIEIAASSTSGGGGGVSTSTPALVQSKKDSVNGIATFTNSVATGNLVVVGVTIWNTTIPSNAITDNKGNTYTKVAEAINAGTTDHAAIFYARNVTGGSSFTVTSSVGGTIAIHEYSGIATSSYAFDKAASSTGTSALPNSGNVTTTIGNELYFGLAWSQGDGDTWGATNGYTLRENETNNASAERLATEDRVITTSSTTQARFTTTTNDAWAAAIVTFRPATTTSAGGGGTSSSTTATTTRYFHADHLNSTNAITDYRGTVVQVLDYYPYGSPRIKSGTDTAQREYIGEMYDESSGLNYLNARYMDSQRGQFLSQDPAFWKEYKRDDLTNPQSLNSYVYAEGNPIVKKDADGLKAEMIYRPVTLGGMTIGSHAFILITPNAGEKSLSIPGYAGASQVTLGAYPSNPNGSGFLKIGINNEDKNLSPSSYLARSSITPPDGMSAANYDQLLVKYAEIAGRNSDSQIADSYWFTGSPYGPSGSYNSNNGATRIVDSTGGKFTPNYFPGGYWAPGIGNPSPVPSSSYTSRLYTTPNGAVIDWGGVVVKPAPSKSK